MALKAEGTEPPTEAEAGINVPKQTALNRPENTLAQTDAEVMKTLAELENEEKVVFLSRKIDEQVMDLDTKLDRVLEKHEKDFLKAYRVQMLKVQDELS